VAATFQFHIEADDCKERLRDDLPRVAGAIEQSLKRSLAQFGFLNWHAPADHAFYIISIRVVQANSRPRDVFLEVSIKGPRVDGSRAVMLPFERFMERRDWTPKVVAQDWAKRAEDIVLSQRAKLVSDVFGLPPLQAQVTLYPQDLKAHVRVSSDGIRASRHPAPKFRVLARVRDPGPPLPSDGEAELTLGGCGRHPQDGTYVCDIEGLALKGRPLSPAAQHQDLMKRVAFTVHSLHVHEYWPDALRTEESVIVRVGAK
jgi:hypothetical protein